MAASEVDENIDRGSKARRRNLSASSSDAQGGDQAKPEPHLLQKIQALWRKLGIDRRTYESMFKGALAPTIAIAAFQSTAWAETYSTLGYLVGIMSILAVPVQPRANFLQSMLVSILFVCTASSVNLLAMFCAIKARENTTSTAAASNGDVANGADTTAYNSSASAVAAVWLFVEIYCISVIRGRNPKYTIPCIMAAIFTNVSCAYAPQFEAMSDATSFAKDLLAAFLTGFAIATGVSLLVFPLTNRQIIFQDMAGYISTLRAVMQANLTYMHSLEEADMFRVYSDRSKHTQSLEAQDFRQKVRSLLALHSKVDTDLPFAKREVALGRLGPDDIQDLARRLRHITTPAVGLSCMSDIFDLITEERSWAGESSDNDDNLRIEVINDWHELMKRLRSPLDEVTSVIDEGLEHVAIMLRFSSARPGEDVESKRPDPRPGSKEFTAAYERRSRAFLKTKETMLRTWCQMHGIELSDSFFDHPKDASVSMPNWMSEGYLSSTHRKLRRQLFLCLYMEVLLYSVARRTNQLMLAVDGYRDHGKLSRTRLIVPGFKRLRNWFISLFSSNEGSHGDYDIDTDGHHHSVNLGEGFGKPRDPEHLPPENWWERFSNHLRRIPHFLQSPASGFGLRVACATMSIAIIAFLRDSQLFYTDQRLFWGQIIVSISMSPTAGQYLRAFGLKVFGTTMAMLLSWVAWYITDGHTAGILVFIFIFLHLGSYVILKHPQFRVVGMIGPVTMVLIIGYELQVRKLGVSEAESNGQVYHPIYELAPIRLAAVVGGLFVAWIWTILPYPISEHRNLRNNLGSSLHLLANYYSIMHETVSVRLRDEQGDMDQKDSPGRELERARSKIYSKANLTMNSLRAQCGFLKFDIPMGGKFPQETYRRLIDDMQSALNFMSMISLASLTFTELHEQGTRDHGLKWLANFRKLVGEANVTSQQLTTLLSLLSASVTNGQPLPPYLRVPEVYILAQKLDELDKDLLSVRHIAEPGYSSFAVIQIGTKCVANDIKKIVRGVRELVGEMDFSYRVVSTESQLQRTETLVYEKDGLDDDSLKQD